MNLPKKIYITEVCPRDGFQNHKSHIELEQKKEIIDELCALGFKRMEVTSFVSPKAIPQMSDAKEIINYFNQTWENEVEGISLIPNLKGAELALKANAKSLIMVISASDDHNLANTGRTVDDSLRELAEICRIKGDAKVSLGVGTAFMCPFKGEIDVKEVLKIIDTAMEMNISHITIADTTGTANPIKVEKTLEEIKRSVPNIQFALHFHDTYGFGLANVLTSMRLGFDSFESATAGMGGCPFAPGATGNLATEDLVNMVEGMGVDTGINLLDLLKVSRKISQKLHLSLSSHAVSTQLGL